MIQDKVAIRTDMTMQDTEGCCMPSLYASSTAIDMQSLYQMNVEQHPVLYILTQISRTGYQNRHPRIQGSVHVWASSLSALTASYAQIKDDTPIELAAAT